MKYKAIAVATLAVFIAAAWCDLTLGPPPIDRLRAAPDSPPSGSVGGVHQVVAPVSNLAELRQNGRINVFAITADNCPDALKLRESITSFASLRPDVAFQIIDLGPEWRKINLAEKFGANCTNIPHVVIYNPDGTVLAQDSPVDKSAVNLLLDWMKIERQTQPQTLSHKSNR
ncbi:MAG: hypothetical protein HN350_10145 [Phycisphaerales bacterium]|jgi:hypothetical protein|nr:hypothetical protein [Phycisphaerales bacterium]